MVPATDHRNASGPFVVFDSRDPFPRLMDLPNNRGPIVSCGRTFFGAADGLLRCLNKTTGEMLFERPTGDAIIGLAPYKELIRDGDVVYAKPRMCITNVLGIVACFELDGTVAWAQRLDGTGFTGPYVSREGIAVGCSERLYLLHKRDGRILTTRAVGEPRWQG